MTPRISLTKRQLEELFDANHRLCDMLVEALDIWPVEEMVVTCVYRTPEEDAAVGGSGVHATRPHRAIDIRIKNLPDPQEQADEVAVVLNSSWQYDPERPEMKVARSDPHGTGPHLHIQCHPRTKRIREN